MFRPRFPVLVLALVIAAGLALAHRTHGEIARQWTSPDGQYHILLYRLPRLWAMPGQGSDAPGRLELRDERGRILASRRIEMVQLASDPEWQPDRVSMKLLFDWDLD